MTTNCRYGGRLLADAIVGVYVWVCAVIGVAWLFAATAVVPADAAIAPVAVGVCVAPPPFTHVVEDPMTKR